MIQFLLLSKSINDKDKYAIFYNRALSEILDGATLKIFAEGKLPDPHYTTECL